MDATALSVNWLTGDIPTEFLICSDVQVRHDASQMTCHGSSNNSSAAQYLQDCFYYNNNNHG